MCFCYSSLIIIALQIVFISINSITITCQDVRHTLSHPDKKYCPFVETLSFGSDIDIKCNDSYLIFKEINNNGLNWKFANQTSICDQNGTQQARVNQCGVRRFGANYLKVSLKSSQFSEKACIYCRINYKTIAPVISVTQSFEGEYIMYFFNITATALDDDASFEILWAKRTSSDLEHSINFWFSKRCIHSMVTMLQVNNRSIVFSVDEIEINRVEFIIRRCHGNCRAYNICHNEDFADDIMKNHLRIPDSIEKLSCDIDCLNMYTSTIIDTSSLTPSTSTYTSKKTAKFLILTVLVGLLLLTTLIVLIIYLISRKQGKKYEYSKTQDVSPDECK